MESSFNRRGIVPSFPSNLLVILVIVWELNCKLSAAFLITFVLSFKVRIDSLNSSAFSVNAFKPIIVSSTFFKSFFKLFSRSLVAFLNDSVDNFKFSVI